MNVIHDARELQPGSRKVWLAIGFFDGVHLGHQQIVRQTVRDSKQHEGVALVITFDQHPNTIVAPERVPPLIYSLPQKLKAIEDLGADSLLLIHFDKEFSRQTGEEFIHNLALDLKTVQSICVGAEFVFGYKRGGDVNLLKRLGAELNFTVHGLSAVSLDGKVVSSTRIREAIQAGDLDAASQMLGRAYSLAGKVVKGDGMGKQLGFATANIDFNGLVVPPKGVYAVHAENAAGRWRAVLNIGLRPTLQNPNAKLQVEAHLLDFQGDLYEQQMEITFLEKLREEKKFGSLAELREQIHRDIQEAGSRF